MEDEIFGNSDHDSNFDTGLSIVSGKNNSTNDGGVAGEKEQNHQDK
jgi:hypothetical protein